MALNYSHRPMFSPHLPEENLVQGGLQERDIRELLPADPFGMDISSTVTALTGWLEDLGADYGGYRGANAGVDRRDYLGLTDWNFWWDTATMEFQNFPGYQQFDGRTPRDVGVSGTGFLPELASGCSGYGCGGFQLSCNLDDVKFDTCNNNARGSFDRNDDHVNNMWDFDFRLLKEELDHCPVYNGGAPFASVSKGLNLGLANDGFLENGSSSSSSSNLGMNMNLIDDGNDNGFRGKNVEVLDEVYEGIGNGTHEKYVEVLEDDEGTPHPAMKYAFPYLDLRDLLSVETVCKSFRQTLRNELLFTDIHIDQPLNDRITDDVLLELTNKAYGELHCLSLVGCQRITDDGLRRVLDANPKLVKLCVPGCTRLSIDGIVNSVRAFQAVAVTGIRYLRVGGIFGMTETHFEELVSLLGIGNNHVQVSHHKPHFFLEGNIYLSCEDDRPIDIEMCPRCQNLRLVYDCPAERCQSVDKADQLCRACTHCIPRCRDCGTCINGEYEETFCFDVRCSVCLVRNKETIPCEHEISQEEPAVSFHG